MVNVCDDMSRTNSDCTGTAQTMVKQMLYLNVAFKKTRAYVQSWQRVQMVPTATSHPDNHFARVVAVFQTSLHFQSERSDVRYIGFGS